MTKQMKWNAMRNLGFLTREGTDESSVEKEKTSEEEQKVPQPPQSAKAQPPPRPPSKYANDKPRLDRIKETMTEKEQIKGKGKRKGSQKERLMPKMEENR